MYCIRLPHFGCFVHLWAPPKECPQISSLLLFRNRFNNFLHEAQLDQLFCCSTMAMPANQMKSWLDIIMQSGIELQIICHHWSPRCCSTICTKVFRSSHHTCLQFEAFLGLDKIKRQPVFSDQQKFSKSQTQDDMWYYTSHDLWMFL